MKNFCSKWLFLTVWITGCLVYFLVFLIQPNQNNALMTISKSISTLLKAHMLLLLLIKTKVTKTIVNSIELLRNNISHQTLHSIHVYFGIAVVVLGIVHGILHMVGTYLILNFAMDIDTLNSYLETPMRHQPTYWELAFQTKASLTGFVMTIILVLIGIYSFKSFRKYDYEAFWYIHLFWPVLIILGCFHGLDERFEKMNFWAWMMLPLIIYLVEYLTKAALVISKSYRMSNIKKFNSDLLEVEIETPANFVASEAQYLQLNIPSQSSLEWHLFYIFPSNKPNFINLYIGREGTWTKQMQELLSQTSSNTPLPKIRVFGPFGSYSDKSYYNYKELMFIANDEYFAPFIPIIARILQQVPEVKIQVIWIHTTTYRNNWLTRLISVLRKYENAKSKLSIYLYLTSSDERFDIRYYLVWRTMEYLTLTNKFINKTSPHDGINWRPPNWEMIFKRAFLNSSLTEIGVFVHGSDTIYESVLNKTRKFTGRRSFKVFRKNFEKMELIHYSQ
jgi:Predicted ferric reductase